jgi:antitoxin component YwqK of YwqJK toxin-antitoxin module
MRSLLACAFLLVSISSFSQTPKIPLINSGEVLEKAEVLKDSLKYQEAIEILLTIPKRDTNYQTMLTELAGAYLSNKDFDNALKTTQQALEKPSAFRARLLKIQAMATDQKGDPAAAINLFRKALQEYPADYDLMFNLGITYYNNKNFKEAVDCFFNVLAINPFHSLSHLNLGRISMLQGRKVHGMFSMGMYLSIVGSDNKSLVLLDNFLDNEVTDEGTMELFGTNATEKLDKIIQAKIALDENFQSIFPIKAAVVKQYELLFQQLGTINTTTDDQWIKYYLPVYKLINESKMIEPFTYFMLNSSTIEVAKKWRQKNEKELNLFFTSCSTELKKKREYVTLPSLGFEKPTSARFSSGSELESIGKGEGELTIGPWVYVYSNQQKKAEGTYDSKGKKTGLWNYYENDGVLKTAENYSTGEVTVFFPSGSAKEKFLLKDDLIDGPVSLFYECGPVSDKLVFEKGKRMGKGESFYMSGKLKSTYHHIDNLLDGAYNGYFEDGKSQYESNYKAGVLDGKYKSFFRNGKTESEGTYLKGNFSGTWTYYYSNGNKKRFGNYTNEGLATGDWLYFDRDGTLNEKRTFAEDLLQGDNIFYENGKMYATQTFKKGKLIKVVYYNTEGKVVSTTGAGDGTFKYKGYFATGQLMSEGEYVKGEASGHWKYYNRYGRLVSESNYKAGLLEGPSVTYHASGKVTIQSDYKNGERDGYYKEFYASGNIKAEGWLRNGNREQQWLSYYPDGKLESDDYYLNNEASGQSMAYAVDGKLASVFDFDHSKIKKMVEYGNNEKIVSLNKNVNGVEHYEVFYSNKALKYKYEIRCGEYVNQYYAALPDGKTFYRYKVAEGVKDGPFEYNFSDGKKEQVGQYVNGERAGTDRRYHYNGTLFSEGHYSEGTSDSTWTFYWVNGKVSSQANYKDEKKHGISRYYTWEGLPIMEKLFVSDDLVSWRAVNADGTAGEWKPFTGAETIVVYHPNGKKAIEEPYRNGMRHGTKRSYHSNGNIFEEYVYVDGEREGMFRQKYPNGKPMENEPYLFDQVSGKVENFSEDGSLLKSKTYLHGVPHGEEFIYEKGGAKKKVEFWNGKIQF